MKGQEGRRGPLSGLLDRFSLDAIKRQTKIDQDKQKADAIARLRMQAEVMTQPDNTTYGGGHSSAVKRHERRAKGKRARAARRRNRVG